MNWIGKARREQIVCGAFIFLFTCHSIQFNVFCFRFSSFAALLCNVFKFVFCSAHTFFMSSLLWRFFHEYFHMIIHYSSVLFWLQSDNRAKIEMIIEQPWPDSWKICSFFVLCLTPSSKTIYTWRLSAAALVKYYFS